MPSKRSLDTLFAGGRRNPATAEEIRFGIGKSSIGAVLVASSDVGIISIRIGRDPDALVQELEERFPQAHLVREQRESRDNLARVIQFLDHPSNDFDLPLDLRGTAFQQRVWEAVRQIPVGETSNYSEIAQKIGKPKAIRAVGTSCALNPLSFIIPCHRVLRKSGALSGGDWGDNRQQMLLDREAKKQA